MPSDLSATGLEGDYSSFGEYSDARKTPFARTHESMKEVRRRYRRLVNDFGKLVGREPGFTRAELEDLDPITRELHEACELVGWDYKTEMAALDPDTPLWTEKAAASIRHARGVFVPVEIERHFAAEVTKDTPERDVAASLLLASEYFEGVRVDKEIVASFALILYHYVFQPKLVEDEEETALNAEGRQAALEEKYESLFTQKVVQATIAAFPETEAQFLAACSSTCIYEVAAMRSGTGYARHEVRYLWTKAKRKYASYDELVKIGRAALALHSAVGELKGHSRPELFCPTCAEWVPLKKNRCCEDAAAEDKREVPKDRGWKAFPERPKLPEFDPETLVRYLTVPEEPEVEPVQRAKVQSSAKAVERKDPVTGLLVKLPGEKMALAASMHREMEDLKAKISRHAIGSWMAPVSLALCAMAWLITNSPAAVAMGAGLFLLFRRLVDASHIDAHRERMAELRSVSNSLQEEARDLQISERP